MASLRGRIVAHVGTATAYPARAPISISSETSFGIMKASGMWPIRSKASMRPSAMRGPVLTTMRSASPGKGDLVDGVFGSQVAHRNAYAGKGHEESDTGHPAQLGSLARRHSAYLEELGG